MTHRLRVLAALNHQEPDRVPVDLGATRSTSIVVQAYERLNAHLGAKEDARIFSKWLNIAHPSQAMLARFDIDTRSVSQGSPDHWQDIIYEDGASYQAEWSVAAIPSLKASRFRSPPTLCAAASQPITIGGFFACANAARGVNNVVLSAISRLRRLFMCPSRHAHIMRAYSAGTDE